MVTTSSLTGDQVPKTLAKGTVFRRFAHAISRGLGSPWAFAIALLAVAAWALAGPLFGYSNGWQLFINTGTTIMTFLMVFVIQNTQNRDSKVTQLKLDELIRAVNPARNELVNMEGMSDEELLELQRQFEELRKRAEARRAARQARNGLSNQTISVGEARDEREGRRETDGTR